MGYAMADLRTKREIRRHFFYPVKHSLRFWEMVKAGIDLGDSKLPGVEFQIIKRF